MTSIATLGSHCSLQVLKGAKDEGFRTLLVCERKRERLYRRFGFIDQLILVDSFREILDKECSDKLQENNAVLIPHGTLIAQMSSDEIESIQVPMFGNKNILRWESDRNLKEKMMKDAGLNVPKGVPDPSEISGPVIVKRQGAAGGKGYFIATSPDSYMQRRAELIRQKIISEDETLYIQEYTPGVLAYLQYFYSPLKQDIEFYGVDQRHESNIEGLGRIPASVQMRTDGIPSFNVIGNSAMVLRESLLEEVYSMGERFVESAKRLVGPGMNGPFCIEGVYDENAKFTAFEFSARIVAGTNIYMEGSPYSTLFYDQPMSMGRRIAREIKLGIESERLDDLVT